MPVLVVHLRRWFAGGAIAAILTVAGVYFYARHRVQDALKQVPEKIGIEIKQSATGFTISRSEQGRTLFKIEASKAVQFKQGGRAELHDVAITLYGRDSSRYDHIYGSDFEYDPQSGDVSAKGEIEIDLEANPAGILNPDQAVPKELKNPIHLKTSGLVFNQKTGDAYTKERVEFRLPQATGSALGITYREKTSEFTLESDIQIVGVGGSVPMSLAANRGTIARNPRQIVLEEARLTMADRECNSQKTTVLLRPNNTIDRILAAGEVRVSSGKGKGDIQSDQLAITFAPGSDHLRTAIFSGNVRAQGASEQVLRVTAGRVIADFSGGNLLVSAHAQDNVNLSQHPSDPSSHGQDVELSASGVDFDVVKGKRLDHAETVGAARVTIRPANARVGEQTVVTAGKFSADFDRSGQLTSVHGGPDARIVSQNPGQSDRISTSETIDATFHPGADIESVMQQGSVVYADGERKAWGDRARYVPADQSLQVTGSPRIVEGPTTTSAGSLRFNRATGEAFAQGGVKSTYSDLKPQAEGALLASASPIHVTADSMTLKGTPAVAVYSGKARLWQDANIIEAPSIEFDRDRRSMIARGTAAQPVSSVLVQIDKSGKSTPVAITASRLTYVDADRKAHLEGNVVVKAAEVIITARQTDAFLQSRGTNGSNTPSAAGRLDKIVASGGVVVTEPGRRATGEQLVYQAAEDKFVLTGDSPSIFDAEHGKITGVSLTFYRHDDTVLVEGNSSSPAVTETRVAR